MISDPVILFLQGGGKGAFKEDKHLALFLKNALGSEYKIIYPRIPNESDPVYNPWKEKIDHELKYVENKIVMVGHSLGGYFLLKYLTEIKSFNKIAGLFFISIPYLGEGGWQFGDTLGENLASKLPGNIPMFFYHSTNDEIVPFEHLAQYSKKLPGATFQTIIGRGHQLQNDLTEIVHDIKSL